MAIALGLVLAGGWGCSDDGSTPPSSGSPDAEESVDLGRQDTGPDEVDAGFPDTGAPDLGPQDCSGNPFNCAPMQLRDIGCRCLDACEGDLQWDPMTSTCVPSFLGQCGQDSDCPGPDDICLNPSDANGNTVPCAGEPECACFTGCDPFTGVVQAGCPVGQDGAPLACTHLLTGGLNADAVCLQPGTGGTQNDFCDAPADCNRFQNFLCERRTVTATVGACQRICDPSRPGFCETFTAGLVCNPTVFQDFTDLGLCGPPRVPLTDFGTSCTNNVQCNGLCSTVLGSACLASCAAPASCAEGSQCITFGGDAVPPGERSLCLPECSGGAMGDLECQAFNPDWVCRDLGINLCATRCDAAGIQITCGSGVCDPATGRCL